MSHVVVLTPVDVFILSHLIQNKSLAEDLQVTKRVSLLKNKLATENR
jgi:hypothetical protein